MAKAIKASDKQAVWRKVSTALKKRYKDKPPEESRPVLETLLYASCLENTTHDQAEKAYNAVLGKFFDLNEIRVSSITELSKSMGDVYDAERRGFWIRSILQHVFESNYEYQFEKVRRKTLELAARHLGRIPNITPFIRLHTLQQTMAAFVTPIDDKMNAAATWLGFLEPGTKNEDAADAMKSAVKKADAAEMIHLLRLLANDPALQVAFEDAAEAESGEEYDLLSASTRLNALFKSPPKRKKVVKPKATKKAASKKAPKKKPAAKAAAPKKAVKKKAATKKKVVKKKPAKKAPAASKATKKKTAKKKVTKKKITKKKVVKKKAVKKKAAKKKR
jgi:endonuclease-3